MSIQIGDAYLEELKSAVDLGELKTRVIKPVTLFMMLRFDVLILVHQKKVEVINVMFYRKGDREAEKRALQGDRESGGG